MNLCFLFAQIITDLQYDFFYNSKKHISIIKFKVKEKNNIINVIAYDDMADYIYRSFYKQDFICILGYLNNKMHVNVLKIEK